MTTGTSLVTVKQTMVTALRARAGLAGVQVLYGPDDFVSSDDHVENEAIWFGDTEWTTYEMPVMRAGTQKVDENYELTWTIQVIKDDGSTQEVCDLRAKALLAELQQALAEAPGISPETFWVQLRLQRHKTGQVVSGPGHGARFEGVLEVRARLTP